MLTFLIKRLAQAGLVLMSVSFCSFLLFNFVGDPVQQMMSATASTEDREALREQLGLNASTPVQFVKFIGNIAHGNFGNSYRLGRPVERLIAERLPATLELVAVAAVFALVLGIGMGLQSGLAPTSLLAKFTQWGSLIGVSLPTFFIGIGLITVFSVWLGWFPAFGRGDVIQFRWWSTGLLTASGLQSIVLPGITLSLFLMTLVMRLVRGELLEVMRTDYIKFARARGLSKRLIYLVYAFRNTLVPVITVIGLQIGSLVAFSIITETVFNWPGLGLMFVDAIQFADIPVMATYLMLVALVFVVINLIVDVLYLAIDPRLRVGSGGSGAAT
jgi:peptide/nickel transport system permease protein